MEERTMSDTKQHRQPSFAPWPLEELVRAQRMACDGANLDTIAQALGRPANDVRRKLDPEPAAVREEYANVAYRHLKRR
jgi:hypothetical protein